MKFKTLFFLFNLIILISFTFVFVMPIPILGWQSALTFWVQNWPVALLFVAILAALDSYFLVNWRLFSLLEREDWPGLRALLEAELEKRGTLGLQKTKIFLNACLIGQQPSRISQLRELYLEKKSPVVARLALSLGLPLVLEGKSEAIESFFGPLAESRKTGTEGPWIRWCVAFGRLLAQNPVGARPLLEGGLKDKKQPLLQLLSLYLLDNLRDRDPDVAALVDREKVALSGRLTPKEWSSHIEGLKERIILVLFMEKLIGEARQWLGAAPQGAPV